MRSDLDDLVEQQPGLLGQAEPVDQIVRPFGRAQAWVLERRHSPVMVKVVEDCRPAR